MVRKFRGLSRLWKVGLLAFLVALLSLGGVVIFDGGPDSKQGVDVLGTTQERPGEVQVAGAQATRPTPDTTPPTISVSFPQSNRVYGADAWANTCSPTGVCGRVSDPSGVSRVEVAVRHSATGQYWNAAGNAFSSNTPVFNQAAGTTTWLLALPLPADGSYSLLVQATDAPGNTTPANRRASLSFGLDTVAPPAPVISRQPDDVTFDTSADFAFTDLERDVSFRCQLDDATPAACSDSPKFSDLSETDHRLQVWALDAARNQSSPVSYSWTVAIKKSFGISGDASQLLYPGVGTALDVTVDNPFNFPIRVIDITVAASGPAGCPVADNLTITASSFSGSVVVPAHSSRTLSSLSVPAAQRPQLQLRNRDSNQGSCKNVKFSLTYNGTGTKA